MELLNKQKADFNKPELEQVVKEKQEYKLIETILRTRGLNLYAYDQRKDVIFEVRIERKNVCYTKPFEGKLIVDIDQSYEKTMIDPRNEHFEALNYSNAVKRVRKYKKGLIKELSNLRHPTGNTLSLF